MRTPAEVARAILANPESANETALAVLIRERDEEVMDEFGILYGEAAEQMMDLVFGPADKPAPGRSRPQVAAGTGTKSDGATHRCKILQAGGEVASPVPAQERLGQDAPVPGVLSTSSVAPAAAETGHSTPVSVPEDLITFLERIPNPCCGKLGANIMDAPDGPRCHCGNPSALEDGCCTWCARPTPDLSALAGVRDAIGTASAALLKAIAALDAMGGRK